MDSIGSGSARTEQAKNAGQAGLEGFDQSDDAVKRGFSNQNSYSRTEGDAPVKSQTVKPQLDSPTQEVDAGQTVEKTLKDFQHLAENPISDGIREGFKGLKQPSLAAQAAKLQGKKSELETMGFSESQISGILSMADPNDPENSLSSMHSVSARVKAFNSETGKSDLGKLYDTFEDVVTKMAAITEIPEDLQSQLEADFKKLSKLSINNRATLDTDRATSMLMEIQAKLQNERIKFDQETIRIGMVSKEQASNKQIEKIRESIEKANEAKKGDSCGRVFSFIAIAFVAVATVALVATGAGALAVGLMIAALALTVTMTVSSETNNFMMKMFGDSMGGQIGAMVFWTAVMVVLTLGASAAASGASAAGNAATVAQSATTGASVVTSGANTAATVATTASKVARIATRIMKIAQYAQGGASIGEGGAKIASTVYTYQADQLRASAMEDKAFMLRLQQQMDDAMESLQKAIDELQAGYGIAANIIKANHETKTTLARNLRA